ncbi:NB-ARC domain-containing protein [Streptomyces sp. NPDC052287]|uniref:ATP-binding protein n=1 Tax=Streptomyces sp. NPDC052287 TaxID=3154950 RepID=UPI00344351A4
MRRERVPALIGVVSGLLSVLLAVAVNVATGGSLPPPLDAVAWLSWPAVGVLAAVVVGLAVWQQRLTTSPSAGAADGREEAGRPAELPAAPGLTGRARDLAAVDEALEQRYGVVTFVGPPGVGKSSLALRVAHDLRGRYPDGQLFAALRGASADPAAPEAVLARFLGAMGVAEDERRGAVENLAARFRSELADRKVLLVLDDARDAEQVAPLLPGDAGCLAVVTSRRVLAGIPGSATHLVGGLDPAEGLALLTEAVGADRAAADPDAAVRIVRACGGLPLALRIAGGRLRARVSWQLADFADQLEDERQRLDALRLGDLAVRASFDASYEELPAVDRLVFRRCGSHPGQIFGSAAAAALAGREPPAVTAALERLVDAQLVESPAPGRYRLHDLLRLFAVERTEAEDTPEVRVATLARLLDLLTGHAAVGNWLADERENVVAALRQAVASGLYEPAWALASAVGPLLSRAEDHVDRLPLWHAAAEAADALDDDPRRVRALLQMSYACRNSGDVTAALDSATRALSVAERLGGRPALAEALLCHGEALRDLYRFDEAAEALTRAVVLYAELGDEEREIQAGTALGALYMAFWHADEAVEVLERAVALLPAQDSVQHAWTIGGLSTAYRLSGRRGEAIALNERALRIARAGGGDLFALGYQLAGRAWLAHEDGRTDDALTDMREMLTVFERMRHSTGAGLALEGIAGIAMAAGRHDDAIEASEAAAVRFDRTGDRVRAGRVRLQQAVALAEGGRTDAAGALWRTADALIGDAEPPEVPRLRDRLREILGDRSPSGPGPTADGATGRPG